MQEKLIEAAIAARLQAYAPYSGFFVGAAVLAGGRIFSGCNVENASYGLTCCAERTAVFAAVAAGAKEFAAIAIVTSNGGSPCGACRQVLREFGTTTLVIMSRPKGRPTAALLQDLLPDSFGPEQLR